MCAARNVISIFRKDSATQIVASMSSSLKMCDIHIYNVYVHGFSFGSFEKFQELGTN